VVMKPDIAKLLVFLVTLTSACAGVATRPPNPTPAGGEWTSRLQEPVTAPTIFESPMIHTSVRPIFIRQKIADKVVNLEGVAEILALQIRHALCDRLAIIATKDGIINLDLDGAEAEQGFADLAAGLKYLAHEDADKGLPVSAGATVEVPVGKEEVGQGQHHGILRPFVSVGLERAS